MNEALAPSHRPPADWRARLARIAGRLRARSASPGEESGFLLWYSEYIHARIRRALWMTQGTIGVLMFAGGPIGHAREAILGGPPSRMFEVVRWVLFSIPAAVMILVANSRFYTRWFPLTAQIALPLHALAFALIGVISHAAGHSTTALMLLSVIGTYNAFGLSRRRALRTVVVASSLYLGVNAVAGLQGVQWIFDASMLMFAVLAGAITHAMLMKGTLEQYEARRTLGELACRDGLTSLFNRRTFDGELKVRWAQCVRTARPLGLLMIDIDHFKKYNDSFGHQAGDECLKRVATLVAGAAKRPFDLAARYGGEEFAVLLFDVNRSGIETIARAIHERVAAERIAHRHPHADSVVTVSIGAACVEPRGDRSPAGLIQLADQALYAAKEGGRSRTVLLAAEYDALRTGIFNLAATDRGASVRSQASTARGR